MFKKVFILSLSIAVLFVFSAPISPVTAGGKLKKNIKIDWKIAGTVVQYIEINKLNSSTGQFYSAGMHCLINLSAQGAPGPAKITLLCQAGNLESSFDCISLDYTHVANFSKNEFIALFPDQSLLFASIDEDEGGILCINRTYDTTYFIVKMKITGGKGRFEGASGCFTAEGHGYPGLSSDRTLVGENGRVKGWIKFSDE